MFNTETPTRIAPTGKPWPRPLGIQPPPRPPMPFPARWDRFGADLVRAN